MAEQKQDGQGASSSEKKQEETYHVDRLVAESGDRLGVPSHVAAGAFAALGGNRKNLTVDEAKQAVKDFEKRKVEVDNPFPTRAGEEL